MPELPDVEIFKRIFEANTLDKRVVSVRVFDHRILADTDTSELRVALEGDSFVETRRVGKILLVRLPGREAWRSGEILWAFTETISKSPVAPRIAPALPLVSQKGG